MPWTFYNASGEVLTNDSGVADGGNDGALVLGTNDSNSLTLETNNTARMVLAAGGDVTVSTGSLLVGNGSAGSPAISFTNDPNTGFILEGAGDSFSVSLGGASRFGFRSDLSGRTTGTFSGPEAGAAAIGNQEGSATVPSFYFNDDSNTGMYRIGADQLGFTTAGALSMSIAATGRVTMRYPLNIETAAAGIAMIIKDTDSTGTAVNQFIVFKGSDDVNVGYMGKTSTGEMHFFNESATPTKIGAGGHVRLTIAADGDVTVSSGNVVIGTAGKGIDFAIQASPAAGMTSELLDRYEEGTWTAQIQGSTGSAGSAAYTGQGATYTRIGRMVTVYMSIRATNLGSWTGTMRITGLPFTNGGIGAAGSVGMLSSSALDATVRACHIPASAAYIEFKAGSYLDGGMNLSEYHTSYNTQVNVTYFV